MEPKVVLSDAETEAGKVIPVRKKAAPQAGGGGGAGGGGARAAGGDPAEAARMQYYAMEFRVFANGKRSVLDIRNAVAAEFGPMDVAKVMEFFKTTEKSGEFELTKASSAASR